MELEGIKQLGHSDAHRICTGQVILSLGGAVKELIENAVDAGAKNIEVRFEEHGCDAVEVIDDGSGIKEKDFESVALPHATSKLSTFDGLSDLTSFGFRGEALSSLASVGSLEIVTRTEDCPSAFHLKFNQDGSLLSATPCSRQVGTTVRVLRLFEPLAVRRKELVRNAKREFHKAHLVVVGYALIGGTRITCTSVLSSKKQVVLRASGGSVRENVSAIWGHSQLKSLIELTQVEPSLEVREEFGVKNDRTDPWSFGLEGYLSTSEQGLGRSAGDRQFVYINGRPCDYPRVCKVANEVFKLFNRPQYPVLVLDIKVDAGGADINLTPDKRTILVKNEKLLLATLKSSMLKTYTDSIRSTASLSSSSQATANRQLAASQGGNILKTPGSSPGLSQSPLSQFVCPAKRWGKSISAKEDHTLTNCIDPTGDGASQSDELCDVAAEYSDLNGAAADSNYHGATSDIVTGANTCSVIQEDGAETTKCIANAGVPSVDSGDQASTHDEFDFAKNVLNEHIFENEKNEERNEGDWSDNGLAGGGLNNRVLKRRNSAELERVVSESKVPKVADKCPSQGEFTNDLSREPANSASHSSDEKDGSAKILLKTSQGKVIQRACTKVSFSLESLRSSRAEAQTRENAANLSLCDDDSIPGKFSAAISSSQNEKAERELDQLVSKDTFNKMQVIGQFNRGFIITKIGNELFIVDQHASDEKATFERLQLDVIVNSQKLIQTRNLELSSLQEQIVLDNLEMFAANGFEFAVNAEGEPGERVRLSAVPIYGNWTFDKQDIEELISNLSIFPGVMYRPTKLRTIFASKACRSSVMIGTALNQSQMDKIVKNLANLKQPWNCPHGRPTMRHLFGISVLDEQFDDSVNDPVFTPK